MANLPRLLPLIAIAIGGVVAVRAVGAGPEILQGAKAWAEDVVPGVAVAAAVPAIKPIAAVCALTPDQLARQAGMSPAELRIIQSLMKRREELDVRDTDFATMLPLMATAESKLDAKVQALNAIKAEVQGLLGQVDTKAQAETDRLVAVYSAMRPKDAAAVFNTLSDDVRLPVAAAMRPRGLAAVLSQMPPVKAQELTEKLARRFQAQQLAARAAAASANPASVAATPAVQSVSSPAGSPAATNKPAATTPAATTPAATTPTAGTTAGTAAARPATTRTTPSRPRATPRSVPRAATPTASRSKPAATASAPPAGPQPYAAGTAATSANPASARQSVQ